jgi:hypothetical protein
VYADQDYAFPRASVFDLNKIKMQPRQRSAPRDDGLVFDGMGNPILNGDGETELGRWILALHEREPPPSLAARFDPARGWQETAAATSAKARDLAEGEFCLLLTEAALRCTLRKGTLAGWGPVNTTRAADVIRGKRRRLFVFLWPLGCIDNIGMFNKGSGAWIARSAPEAILAGPWVQTASESWSTPLNLRRPKADSFLATLVSATARAQARHPDSTRRERAEYILSRDIQDLFARGDNEIWFGSDHKDRPYGA